MSLRMAGIPGEEVRRLFRSNQRRLLSPHSGNLSQMELQKCTIVFSPSVMPIESVTSISSLWSAALTTKAPCVSATCKFEDLNVNAQLQRFAAECTRYKTVSVTIADILLKS